MPTNAVRIASWNCAAAFREKVARALALDADIYVIQEAEAPGRYAALLPDGYAAHYEVRPGNRKGILVLARPGFALAPSSAAETAYAHIVPLGVRTPTGAAFTLWAVWTLDASRRSDAYVGQAHLALDALAATISPGTAIIGDFNSNSIWDHAGRRGHSDLVERLSAHRLTSAYHSWTGESQGEEKTPTFYLQRNRDKPFHIDHCFTDLEVLGVELGTYEEWSGLKEAGGVSDHVPLVVDLALRAT